MKLIIHTHEGLISDTIDYCWEGKPMACLPNNQGSWLILHMIASLHEVVVVHTRWDRTTTETPWLESAPYKHRAKFLTTAQAVASAKAFEAK